MEPQSLLYPEILAQATYQQLACIGHMTYLLVVRGDNTLACGATVATRS